MSDETSPVDFFKIMLLVQAFFGLAMTLFVYAIPAPALSITSEYSALASGTDLNTIRAQVEGATTKSTSVPLYDVGALVYYSGNILIDLLLNFVMALPAMIGLIIHGIGTLISIDALMLLQVKIFAELIVMVIYFISIIQLLTGIRAGRVV
jgi:hypothetical protein